MSKEREMSMQPPQMTKLDWKQITADIPVYGQPVMLLFGDVKIRRGYRAQRGDGSDAWMVSGPEGLGPSAWKPDMWAPIP